MIDIDNMQYSFWLDWAEKYIKGGEHIWKYIADIFYKGIGCTFAFKSNVTGNKFKGIETVNSSFWKNVLCTWLDSNVIDNATKESVKTLSTICNNSCITYRN